MSERLTEIAPHFETSSVERAGPGSRSREAVGRRRRSELATLGDKLADTEVILEIVDKTLYPFVPKEQVRRLFSELLERRCFLDNGSPGSRSEQTWLLTTTRSNMSNKRNGLYESGKI
jgi:hypothetical protein